MSSSITSGEQLQMLEDVKPSHKLEADDQEPSNLEETTIESKETCILDKERTTEGIPTIENNESGILDKKQPKEDITTIENNETCLLNKEELNEDIREVIQNEVESNTERQGELLELEENHQLTNNLIQTTIEDKEASIQDEKQLLDDVKDSKPDNEGKSDIKNQNDQVEKVQENVVKLKKPKAASKQKYVRTSTVPQPFSLGADSRTSRERNGSLLPNTESKSKLSKSVSLNLKDAQNSNGTNLSSELKRGGSVTSRSIVARNSTLEKQTENGTKLKGKVQARSMESKNTQGSTLLQKGTKVKDAVQAKDVAQAKAINKKSIQAKTMVGDNTKLDSVEKSTPFKASPLPSFYRRKDPAKPELKKVPVPHPNPPQPDQRSKYFAEGIHTDKEDINKSTSRKISITAKESIHKLLQGAWKAPDAQKKKVLKSSSSFSSGSRIEKEII